MPEDRRIREEQLRGGKGRKESGEEGRKDDGRASEEKKEEGCLVCFSEFDSGSHLPGVLPCGHAFCRSCLRHPSLSPAGLLRCPLCRHLSWGRDTLRRETSSPVVALWASTTTDRGLVSPRASLTPQQRRDNQPLPANLEMTPTSQGPSLLSPLTQLRVSTLDETWFMNRCALCCRRHAADSYPLDCRHSLCPRCLESLLALAVPGWVAFLYCPRCSGQTAVFSRRPATTTHLPTRANPQQGPMVRPRALERAPGIDQRQCCCGVGIPCTLL
ncbi:uncharacterized protein LOC121724966 [Alosa sapidissima]|uniref:uncharacterized protein LOC121724966 n=1 Tax=Alosa sapidissima TaxID=34773 RepID=UPI001C0911AF|nr:uncharacterized protein LOC121724966 [Alosa sapidissima]